MYNVQIILKKESFLFSHCNPVRGVPCLLPLLFWGNGGNRGQKEKFRATQTRIADAVGRGKM